MTFKKTTFGNGLTLISERYPGGRSLSIGVWVKAGTRHERPSEQGVSHFLEHMLFKGTSHRTALQIAREIEQVGGEFNAFTGRENTCFHVLLLDRDLELGLDILTDVLLYSEFDAEEFERERKVIIQEISMVEEAPEELAHDFFNELVWPRHGLGRNILGTETSIRRMKRGKMMRFFRKHYVPRQLIIAVSGNVAHSRIVRKLKRILKSKKWPGRARVKASKRALGFEPTPDMREGCWWVERPTEQVHIVWGVPAPRSSSKDRFAAYLLNVHLGGGMSATLFQEIREKRGLAYTVYANYQPYQDAGLFTVYAATQLKDVVLCLDLINECVQQVCTQALSEVELNQVKDNLKGTILLSADDAENRMSSIARNEIFYGEYVSPDRVCELIDEVTPQDLRRVARKLFARTKPRVLCLGPKPTRSILTKLHPERPRRYRRT